MTTQLNINFDAELTREETQVLSLLQRGRENARSVRFLAAVVGVSEVRLREIVRHIIMDHDILIASSVGNPPGFFFPETEEEVMQATKSLRRRGIKVLMRAAKLQKLSLEEIFHQARLELEKENVA
jgi:ABC-type ATPase involved in cell division